MRSKTCVAILLIFAISGCVGAPDRPPATAVPSPVASGQMASEPAEAATARPPTASPYPTNTPAPTYTFYPIHTSAPTYTRYPTFTPLPTGTPGALPTATSAVMPTARPAPTATSEPTRPPTPVPSPTRQVARAVSNANLRAGPGTNYPIVGNVFAGQELDIVARAPESDWLQLPTGAWVFLPLVQNAPAVPTAQHIPPAPASTLAPPPTNTPVPAPPAYTPVPPPPAPTNLPPPLAPAGESQTLASLTSPTSPGATATIVVQTQPGVRCSIIVWYKSGPSEAKGLAPQMAGGDGRCSWTWKVGTNTTRGTWRIEVTTGNTTKNYNLVVQ